ncbi:30S ribosomal protein S16 [candidate division WOR-3 bacterium]|uniref:Small ribosomal subunit protein bS16 n=1 Tax=candidate division WOR-3 bacterium TaxID=2052148 RepID=A0A660SHH6_UNCW3|nr:MAG: 30S ribosomal protein S16 [candidate division WOR-3 bacterium]
MLKIRLQRVGRRNLPLYRIVVIDSRKARDGESIEVVGNYDPRADKVAINTERVDFWLGRGAQLTNRVRKLLQLKKKGGGDEAAD